VGGLPICGNLRVLCIGSREDERVDTMFGYTWSFVLVYVCVCLWVRHIKATDPRLDRKQSMGADLEEGMTSEELGLNAGDDVELHGNVEEQQKDDEDDQIAANDILENEKEQHLGMKGLETGIEELDESRRSFQESEPTAETEPDSINAGKKLAVPDMKIGEKLVPDSSPAVEQEVESDDENAESAGALKDQHFDKEIVSPLQSEKDSLGESERNIAFTNYDNNQKQLEEKNRQIESLQAQLMTLGSQNGESSKVVSLAKKNRSLNVSLEKERSKVKKLENQVCELNKEVFEISQAKEKCPQSQVLGTSGNNNSSSSKVADLEIKCDQMRQRVLKATNEAKKLKRLLAQEVGEGPELVGLLQSMASTSNADDPDLAGSWRGRAQKIILLKEKLKRAHSQLARSQGLGTPESKLRPTNVDEKAALQLRSMEFDKRVIMEKLARENEELQSEMASVKRSGNAAKARAKVLENENKRHKEQLKILLKKTENDNALVDALRKEVDRLKHDAIMYRDRSRELEQNTTSTFAFEELKQHSLGQAAQIERQSKILAKMRAEVDRIRKVASSDIVKQTNDELDNQAHAVKSQLLQVENDRLSELVDLFKSKLERAVLDRQSALSKCKTLERSKVELERRLGNIHALRPKRQVRADQLSEMQDRIKIMEEECRSLKNSTKQALAQKDEEINILRELGREIKQAYEKALQSMKQHVERTALAAAQRFQAADSHVDNSLLDDLTADNEILRNQLRDRSLSPTRDKALSPTRSSIAF